MRTWRPSPAWSDQRGDITDLLDDVSIRHVGLISSKAGSVRGNHIHQKADRYTFVVKGTLEYYERMPDQLDVSKAILSAGDMVFTPAGAALAVRFVEDSVILELNTEPRSNGRYEQELVRLAVPLVSP